MEVNNVYENLKTQALERNDKSVAAWSKYMKDLEVTKSILILLPQKVTHNVMVPVGPKAVMRGKVVHTNELLVNLGETWFAKRTAYQTVEICDRRIKNCVEMLQKLEKERNLIINKSTLPVEQEAFGNEERPEIIEYVTEEENEEWKRQHRVKEKQYRQQLAQLRNKEKKPIETEVDLWQHLDELELQEELEDELNRLNVECSNENIPEEISDSNTLENNIKRENLVCEKSTAVSSNLKRKVFFVCDFDSLNNEPLRLEIKHSELKPISKDFSIGGINSPADIYNQYSKLVNKKPLSVLKCNINFSEGSNLNSIKSNGTYGDNSDNNDDDEKEKEEEEEEEEDLEDISTISEGVRLHDISERCITAIDNNPKLVESKQKKISQFKASRRKN